jgi:hypothetical protein
MRIVCLAPALIVATAVTACSSAPPPPVAVNQSAHGEHAAPAAPAAPPPRATLLGNLGGYSRAIKTTSADAQRWFDEGLNLLYGFNHEESFRSFARAAALDAESPMPHWGMALALGTNINDPAPADRIQKAAVHLAEARKRSSSGTPQEQALIAALTVRYTGTPSPPAGAAAPVDAAAVQSAREQAYSASMREAARKFPDDLDIATLYAESLMNLRPWRLYTSEGRPEPGTDAIVTTLERVMKENPNHPGANHYYIHAVEASTRPDRAIDAAGRLETLVPGAGHLVHMPAHIYIRTGQYARSARSNADAAAVDEKYFKATGATGFYPVMYYGHNLQFESAAAMYAGNFAQARGAAQRTVKLVDPVAGEMAMVEPYAQQEVMVLLRFGRWDEVVAAAPPAPTRTIQTALHHYARGAALAALGRGAEAAAAREAFIAASVKVAKDVTISANNTAVAMLQVAAHDLDGRIAMAGGNPAGAVDAFTRGVAAEDALSYNEPPDWLLPVRERLGVALLRASRARDAERVFREDLRRNVGNPRSLLGLALSLEAQRKTPAAAQVRKQFNEAWSGADVTLGDDLEVGSGR